MELKTIIHRFRGKKILVIGDIMLDSYIWGNVERISPEAPVPVMEVTRESDNLGAAANVVNNILALKGSALLVGVVGADDYGAKLTQLIKSRGLDVSGIFVDPTRPTTTKTRIVVEHPHQQLVRIDKEKRTPISVRLRNKILGFVKECGNEFDAILFEDYDKGTLSGPLIKQIIRTFPDKIITADPKFDNFFEYEHVTLFKPNRREVERAMGVKLTHKNIKPIINKLRERLKCRALLLTLGEEGVMLSMPRKVWLIPTQAREVYDTTGAGDTVIAVATLALAAGASPKDAAIIANIAAGIEVRKFGAIPVTSNELLAELKYV